MAFCGYFRVNVGSEGEKCELRLAFNEFVRHPSIGSDVKDEFCDLPTCNWCNEQKLKGRSLGCYKTCFVCGHFVSTYRRARWSTPTILKVTLYFEPIKIHM